jgi:hypothetical protein
MIRSAIVVALALLTLEQDCFALPEDPQKYAEWENEYLQKITENANLPPEQAIPKLGEALASLSRGNGVEKGDRPVFRAAQGVLLSIPGSVDYFTREIKEITEKEINGTDVPFQRDTDFRALSQLPTPATIKALGEFLFDERSVGEYQPGSDTGPGYANSLHAVDALYKLGLKNPPVHGPFSDPYGDLRSWQLWYEQIRAGNRTFSFKGDSTVYTLAGPVANTSSPAIPSKEEQRVAPATVGSQPSGPSKWLVLAVLLFVAAVIAVMKKSKNSSANR